MMCHMGSAIGRIGVSSYPTSAEVISRNPIPIGTYVAIPFRSFDIVSGCISNCCAIGVISLTSYRRMLPISPTATSSESIGIEDDMLRYSPSLVRIVALVCKDNEDILVRVPNVPPPPDSEVYIASSDILSTLFSCKKESSIKIGHLLSKPDVEIYVDLNALTKHLFITGTTGCGKSNTVAILADRIASYGGIVIIYDVHGEYSSIEMTSNVNIVSIEYKINPLEIPPRILARMIIPEGGATVQRMIVSRALIEAQRLFKELKNRYGLNIKAIENIGQVAKEVLKRFTNIDQVIKEDLAILEEEGVRDNTAIYTHIFKEIVKSLVAKATTGIERESIAKACTKIDEFFENAVIGFDTPSIGILLSPSTIIVINVSLLSDEQKDYVLKVVLDELLWLTKHYYFVNKPLPVIIFIEEAHIFLSTLKATTSRHSIEKIAREGRKFGLALGVISQRPRNIDLNTLSQIQNFVFMKLVQEADQQAIMNASDLLTEDLARSLSSLGTGEAIIIGEWIGRFPVFAKIDRHEGKKIGASLDIAGIWRANSRKSNVEERVNIVSEASSDINKLFS